MSYFLLAGKSVHVPGHLSRDSLSEWDTEVAALVAPPIIYMEMAAPGAYHDTLPQVLQCILTPSKPGYILFNHASKIYTFTGI